MTREEAIALCKTKAIEHVADYPYLADAALPHWKPHEWVIEAVMSAANRRPIITLQRKALNNDN